MAQPNGTLELQGLESLVLQEHGEGIAPVENSRKGA